MKLSGWGRTPVLEAKTHAPRSVEDLCGIIKKEPSVIARGNGRAYGDAAINQAATIEMRHINRITGFNPESGQVVAEAGVLLGDIITAFLPRGLFPRVVPGTKHITLGGAVAADIHGKNHHRDGSFRSCVDWVEVMDARGAITRCSPDDNPDIFDYTLGGMGLTGIITRVAIRLRKIESAWIRQNTIATRSLTDTIAALESDAAQNATYSVAWIDCLMGGKNSGRGIITLGEHAQQNELPPEHAATPLKTIPGRKLSLPFNLPSMTLNRLTIGAFNNLYYRRNTNKPATQITGWDSFFFPLDAIGNWNRFYGSRGFMQFQCVLPHAKSKDGLTALLTAITTARATSFLGVLKRFGDKSGGAFSFPMEGYTLALDFPASTKNRALLERLDAITIEHGGRFYLAKDSRMSAETFRASDNRIDDFRAMRDKRGLTTRFTSAQAERLGL